MIPEEAKLTSKEFLALPIEERRKIMAEQANDPEIIDYYQTILRDEMAIKDLHKLD